MRIALIHGINQQGKSAQIIETQWWEALHRAWAKMGLPEKPKPTISTAYYGDILAQGVESAASAMDAGVAGSTTTATHAIAFLQAYAKAAGVSQAEIHAVAGKLGIAHQAVDMSLPHESWVIGLANILAGILPDKGRFIAELFLTQGASYINYPALAAKIDLTVRRQIFDGLPDPTIVIAHSLGTVVSYRLLANNQQANRNVPLFVTLGSPLGVDIFKPILPPKGLLPSPPIGKWLNGRNREDFITLDRAITKASIGFDGVIDETEIHNPDEDKHSITRYLASPKIAKAIYDTL